MSFSKTHFSKEYILNVIKQYNKNSPSKKIEDYITKLQNSNHSPVSRKNFLGHITASAIILDHTLSKILLVQHKKLNKYIQPGGHVDDMDKFLYSAAKRELEEETGFINTTFIPFNETLPDIPIDVDIHTIPENLKKEEPEHIHIDFRYIFFLENNNQGKINEEEVENIIWKPIKEFESTDVDISRAVQKTNKFISEQRDELFFNKIARIFSLDIKNYNIVMVSHIVPDIPPFINVMQKLTKKITIIPKPNSISSNVLSKIPPKLIYPTSRKQLQNKSVLQKIFPKNEKSLIIDIGGYFATKEFIDFNNKEKRVYGIIEDTENGQQKYEQLINNIQLPIVSVARSELKQNEDDLVGYSVAFYTEWLIRKFRRLPKYLTCGIIGYGKLGRGIAKYLFNQNIKPLIYDINPIKIIEGYKDGCIPVTKEEIISKSELIFCATGNVSINTQDFLKIRPGCYIALATSSDDELDLDDINKYFNISAENNFINKYENESTYWYLMNNGNTINFIDRDGDRVSNFIRLVQGEILCSLQKLTVKKLSYGIQEIKQEDKKKIAREFLNYYHTPL